MAAYATGKNAFGISDRSGFRYRLNEMKREWTGALVGPDEYEPKHPQLEPRKPTPDPQALYNPRPDRVEPLSVFVGVPLFDGSTFKIIKGIGQVGSVGVVIS